MDKDFDQLKGKLKQAAGDLTDDKELAKEGRNDERAGRLKEALNDAKDHIEDAVDKVKNKMNDS